MKRDFYALHDSDDSRKAAIPIRFEDASRWNQDGFGIFWTVNDFGGNPRRAENLVQFNSWFVEIDDMSKAEQLAIIEQGIVPSLVVESRKGFHVYWHCRGVSTALWAEVMIRLGAHYSGDARAKDVARILRVPGFYHKKDPVDPYFCRVVWNQPQISYEPKHMLYFYKPVEKPEVVTSQMRARAEVPTDASRDFWEKVYNFDCEEALLRLSGSAAVAGEVYSFRRQANGNLNVFVNGKSTSCFIDKHKRIGSANGGGPMIWNWLRWFNHSTKDAHAIMRSYFPELYR